MQSSDKKSEGRKRSTSMEKSLDATPKERQTAKLQDENEK
jgi:hypothetical protein